MKTYRNLLNYVFIAVGVLFVLNPLVHAGTNAFEKLRKESANIKTLQANFVQKGLRQRCKQN